MLERRHLLRLKFEKSLGFKGLPPLDPITLLGYWIGAWRLIGI